MTLLQQHLFDVRERADRALLKLVWGLVVATFGLAFWHGTWTAALSVGLPIAFTLTALVRYYAGKRVTNSAVAATLMAFTGLAIHQSHGMIEMHFAVFVLLAVLLAYRAMLPIIVATATIAAHHVLFYLLQTNGWSVFLFPANYPQGALMVAIHAGFVVALAALLVMLAARLRAEIEAIGTDPRDLRNVADAMARADEKLEWHGETAAAGSVAAALFHAHRPHRHACPVGRFQPRPGIGTGIGGVVDTACDAAAGQARHRDQVSRNRRQ